MTPLPTWPCKGGRTATGGVIPCDATVTPMPPTIAPSPVVTATKLEPQPRLTPADPDWQPSEFRLKCVHSHVHDYP